jgi:hypothetical protein
MATETIRISHADYAALCAELDQLRAKTKEQAQQINELNARGLELIVTLADAQQRVADLEFAADTLGADAVARIAAAQQGRKYGIADA